MKLAEFINHSRHRDYMSGPERNSHRIKMTGEIFTPTKLVQQILDLIPQTEFDNVEYNFIDPTCGDGQFLSEIMIRKMENDNLTYEQAKLTTYGADLMADNCIECIRRLWGEGTITKMEPNDPNWPKNYHIEPGLIAVFFWNDELVPTIVQADGLEYGYNFGEKPDHPSGNSLLEMQ